MAVMGLELRPSIMTFKWWGTVELEHGYGQETMLTRATK